MSEDMLTNGVSAETGAPLPIPTLPKTPVSALPTRCRNLKLEQLNSRGADSSIVLEDLSQAGWGLILPADGTSDEVEAALSVLIKRRKDEAGDLFKVFKGTQGVRAGESATEWLARQGVGLDIVDPWAGVPFYLLILASPEEIPFDFQYTLDIYWGVGRLYFDQLSKYAAYAESVIHYEKLPSPPQRVKHIAIFSPEHPFDAASELFTSEVASPLINGQGNWKPLGQSDHFALDGVLGAEATKD